MTHIIISVETSLTVPESLFPILPTPKLRVSIFPFPMEFYFLEWSKPGLEQWNVSLWKDPEAFLLSEAVSSPAGAAEVPRRPGRVHTTCCTFSTNMKGIFCKQKPPHCFLSSYSLKDPLLEALSKKKRQLIATEPSCW